jgi:hypothetical protein
MTSHLSGPAPKGRMLNSSCNVGYLRFQIKQKTIFVARNHPMIIDVKFDSIKFRFFFTFSFFPCKIVDIKFSVDGRFLE